VAARKKISDKEALFVRHYLVDLSYANAARRAGYSVKTAKEQGYQMAQRPQVRAAIDKAMAERAKRLDTQADDVLREIARMAMFDPAHVTAVTCPEDIALLPEDVRRAIVGWSWDRQGKFTVKLAKEGALDMLGRHHGLFKDRVEHSGPNGGPIPVTGVTMSDEQLAAIAARAIPNAAKP
jgi:phage terminase small subunit